MGLISSKAAVRELLAARDFESIKTWAQTQRSPQRVLFSLALDDDELIAWRAIETVGLLSAGQAGSGLEKIRDSIRRLMWLMNDESGGLGWRSPELIGEILVNVPVLINEFGPLLVPYFHEEPFERGAFQAVSRIASINPKPFAASTDELIRALEDKDPLIRYHAASVLMAVDAASYQIPVGKLRDDCEKVSIYDFETGAMLNSTVGQTIDRMLERTAS